MRGDTKDFCENFYDNGPTDMYRMMMAYQGAGINVSLRKDHKHMMAGKSNEHAGYEMNGYLFGIGFIKGLLEAEAGS